MSKMKYIVPFISSQPFIIPLVRLRKNLKGFSLLYVAENVPYLIKNALVQ